LGEWTEASNPSSKTCAELEMSPQARDSVLPNGELAPKMGMSTAHSITGMAALVYFIHQISSRVLAVDVQRLCAPTLYAFFCLGMVMLSRQYSYVGLQYFKIK
jgi:hypothetical protein